MTKREPLAVVETGGPEYQLGNPVRIVVRGKPLSSTTDIEDAYRDAELINDAAESLVKEAVREAVNDAKKPSGRRITRSQALAICKKIIEQAEEERRRPGCKCLCHDSSKWPRPTEPERRPSHD